MDRRLHLASVGLDEEFQYAVGGYYHRIGGEEPIVQLAPLHSGIATSSLWTVPCPSYENKMGNNTSKAQSFCHDYMSEEFPELDRGQAAAVTRRKHVPAWMYKQAHRLTDGMEQIHSEINSIGTLNAGKQREKVLKLLSKWYLQVNAFEAKLKPYIRKFS